MHHYQITLTLTTGETLRLSWEHQSPNASDVVQLVQAFLDGKIGVLGNVALNRRQVLMAEVAPLVPPVSTPTTPSTQGE